MAKKQPKRWVYSPSKPAKPKVPEPVKLEVDQKATALIENVLKPKYIKPPPKGNQLNYITDITTKWLGSKCYFISIYRSPGLNALSPTFEEKFARMEYVGNGKFNLAFMRDTGQWVQLFEDQTVDECLNAIKDDPWFQP